MMIKAYIFDMGGVVLKNNAEYQYKSLCQIVNINFREYMKVYSKFRMDLLTGKMKCHEFAKRIDMHFHLKSSFYDMWKKKYATLMPINRTVLKIINQLNKKYRICLLSNTPDLALRINKKRGLMKSFDFVINSCEIGTTKPNKSVYIKVLHKLNVKASECVLVDDRKEHLNLAREMGFIVYQYTNAKSLHAFVRKIC